jgi:hypothetical protein
MTLRLTGLRARPDVGQLVINGAKHSIMALQDVESGEPPIRPAGYTIRLAFNEVAAAESIAREDPGAVVVSRHIKENRRAALMAACVALLKFRASVP